jgi:hypothetical protein
MFARSPSCLLALICTLFPAGTFVASAQAVSDETAPPIVSRILNRVLRWEPHDYGFPSPARPANPFLISFAATVKGPGGLEYKTPGFYDGNGIWKVRVTPTREGEWSVLSHSSVEDLDGREYYSVCVANTNPAVHGGLLVDRQHPHHFVCEDGTRHFLMGYECDWLWALDMGKPFLNTLEPFLDKLAASGFNHIILNAYAHDTGWRKGNTGADDFGPPPLYAWAGSNEQPDHTRFNLAYWRHYDRVIQALWQRGMTAHIMIKVYNKMVNWPAKGSAEDDLYFRWLIARYAAYPNVVWDFSKEAHNEKDLAYKLGRFRFLRENDPYHRLITNHDDDAAYESGAYDGLLDFRSDQQHNKWHQTILAQRQRHQWPAVNVEFGYEHGPGGLADYTYNVVQTPEEVCRRAWEIYMAGGYGAYYYTYTAWDVIRPEDTPPGYAYFKNLRAFFEKTGYWLLEPADRLVSDGFCLANPAKEYVVFLNSPKPFTLRLENITDRLPAQWVHPFSGVASDAGHLGNGVNELKPPEGWGEGPLVLHVGSSPASP